MYVDFAIIDTDIIDKTAKETMFEAIELGAHAIAVPYHLLRVLKSIKSQKTIVRSCLIDFPMGIADIKTRCHAVEQAMIAGANSVDICMPQILAANRKYDKIREDIREIKKVCGKDCLVKYILEYRSFDHRCLKKICEIFDEFEIGFASASTGFFIDNLADNLIASAFLHENSKEINVIATGNAWTENHFSILNRSGIFGFRAFNIESLRRYRKFTLSNE